MNQHKFYWSLVGGMLLPIIQFQTDTSLFDPTFQTSAGVLNWNLGDASDNVNANDFSHLYPTLDLKTVKVYKGTTSGSNAITSVDLYQDGIVGTLDISSLNSLTTFYVHYNSSLNTIINPCTSSNISRYVVSYCDLIGTLDISGLTGMYSNFVASSNPKLNYILNPNINASTFMDYQAYSCGLMGTLDLRGLTGLGGSIQLYSNPSLNTILNSDSSKYYTTYDVNGCGLTGILDISSLIGGIGTFTYNTNASLNNVLHPICSSGTSLYQGHNCDLTGTLDLSPMSNISSAIYLYNNPKLQNVIFPTINKSFLIIQMQDCSLTTTCIDNILGKLDDWYTSNSPTTDLAVNLSGGSSDKPSVDGSTHIAHLQTIFSGAGKPLTITVN